MISRFRGKAVEGGGRGTKVLRYKRIRNGGSEKNAKNSTSEITASCESDQTVFEKKVMYLPRLKFVEVVLAFPFSAVVPSVNLLIPVFVCFVTVTKNKKRQNSHHKILGWKVTNRSIFNDRDARILFYIKLWS